MVVSFQEYLHSKKETEIKGSKHLPLGSRGNIKSYCFPVLSFCLEVLNNLGEKVIHKYFYYILKRVLVDISQLLFAALRKAPQPQIIVLACYIYSVY